MKSGIDVEQKQPGLATGFSKAIYPEGFITGCHQDTQSQKSGNTKMTQAVNATKPGKSMMGIPAGIEAETLSSGETIEPSLIDSGALICNRTLPCETEPGLSGLVAGEPTIIIHESEGREIATTNNTTTNKRHHTTCNPLVYEAMGLLKSLEYIPSRLISDAGQMPVNLIGLKSAEVLLIMVLRSRKPFPSGAILYKLYPEKVRALLKMSGSTRYKIMIWVYSPQCEWRYYWVNPCAIGYDWEFAKLIKK